MPTWAAASIATMGLGPYRPLNDLARYLDKGDLPMSIAAAKDAQADSGQAIPLDLALRFLPLLATDTERYDVWALRWFTRWLGEARGVTIEQAAELAGCLCELPAEPTTLEAIQAMLG
jgi:hypothetical protein